MKQTIWIARHGNRLDFVHPEWFNTASYPYDPPLSSDGERQAQQLAKRLQGEKITHLFASPFYRAIQTALPLAAALNLPIQIEAGLGEWLNPDWMPGMPDKLPLSRIAQIYPCLDLSYSSLVNPTYPECEIQLKARKALTIQRLLAQFSGNLLLVGHAVSLAAISEALIPEVEKIKTPLAGIVKLVKSEQSWHLELNGDISHLEIAG